MAVTQSDYIQRQEGYDVLISICLAYTLCIFAMRAWIRRASYRWDDLAALVATVLAVNQYIAEYIAIRNGLGQSMHDLQGTHNLGSLHKANLSGVVLFLLSLWTSKAASIAFMARFAQPGRHWYIIYASIAVMAVLGLGSVLAETVACGTNATYHYDFKGNQDKCSNQSLRWKLVTAFDIFTEAIILALPVELIFSLQMPTKKKYWVTAAFFSRFPVAIFSGLHLSAVQRLLHSSDPGLAAGRPLIWREIELTYALAATTVMTLRPFTKEFNTGFGMGGETYRTHGTNANGYIVSSGTRDITALSANHGVEEIELNHRNKHSSMNKAAKVKSREVEGDMSDDGSTVGMTGGGQTTTTAESGEHGPIGQAIGPDQIMVSHHVQQSVSPRHMV